MATDHEAIAMDARARAMCQQIVNFVQFTWFGERTSILLWATQLAGAGWARAANMTREEYLDTCAAAFDRTSVELIERGSA